MNERIPALNHVWSAAHRHRQPAGIDLQSTCRPPPLGAVWASSWWAYNKCSPTRCNAEERTSKITHTRYASLSSSVWIVAAYCMRQLELSTCTYTGHDAWVRWIHWRIRLRPRCRKLRVQCRTSRGLCKFWGHFPDAVNTWRDSHTKPYYRNHTLCSVDSPFRSEAGWPLTIRR